VKAKVAEASAKAMVNRVDTATTTAVTITVATNMTEEDSKKAIDT